MYPWSIWASSIVIHLLCVIFISRALHVIDASYVIRKLYLLCHVCFPLYYNVYNLVVRYIIVIESLSLKFQRINYYLNNEIFFKRCFDQKLFQRAYHSFFYINKISTHVLIFLKEILMPYQWHRRQITSYWQRIRWLSLITYKVMFLLFKKLNNREIGYHFPKYVQLLSQRF